MDPAVLQFLPVALPIMVTIVVTIWIAQRSQNKRFDELKAHMNQCFEEVTQRRDRTEP
jgi:preprotein translocase subunit YajC